MNWRTCTRMKDRQIRLPHLERPHHEIDPANTPPPPPTGKRAKYPPLYCSVKLRLATKSGGFSPQRQEIPSSRDTMPSAVGKRVTRAQHWLAWLWAEVGKLTCYSSQGKLPELNGMGILIYSNSTCLLTNKS